MGFVTIPFEEVDVPFANLQTTLQAKQLDIKSFSASTTIFCRDTCDPSNLYVLLCQRAYWDDTLGKAKSWGGTWETPGGSHDLDENILATAIRETEEETKLRVSHVSSHVYLDLFNHKNVPMARCTFHADVYEELQPQRTWCDEKQCTVRPKDDVIVLVPGEHMDFCWATEAQVRDSLPYNAENPYKGLVILDSKKEIILDVFERLRSSQIDMIELPDNGWR